MKNIVLGLFLLLSIISFSQNVSVMSFNIRYDNEHDGINSWTKGNRKEKVATLVESEKPDILSVQEALHHQILFLEEKFPNYNRVGVGRDDGDTKGEYAAIFYDKNKFLLIDNGTFWLSETPNVPSKGWDATCCNRICTWAKFKAGKETFYVFNAHFDHEGKKAQKKSAELLQQHILKFIKNKTSVILTGDLNVTPDSEAVAILQKTFKDTHNSNDKNTPKGTFNAFKTEREATARIDYIFTNKHLKIKDFKIIDTKIDALYPSDHFPVMATIKIR